MLTGFSACVTKWTFDVMFRRKNTPSKGTPSAYCQYAVLVQIVLIFVTNLEIKQGKTLIIFWFLGFRQNFMNNNAFKKK